MSPALNYGTVLEVHSTAAPSHNPHNSFRITGRRSVPWNDVQEEEESYDLNLDFIFHSRRPSAWRGKRNFTNNWWSILKKLTNSYIPSGRCLRLTTSPPSCAVFMKSGNFNFLEPCGPLRTCNGTALPLPYIPSRFHIAFMSVISNGTKKYSMYPT